MEILAVAAETLRVPAAVDLAAVVVGALTGGLLAAREGFALSGVLLLAVSGGLGGGLIRDVLLAEGPPVALTNPAYLPTVAITAMVTFFFSGWLSRLTALLVVLDALTLGFFTVVGAQKAELAGLPSASVVFIGTLTAVGGALIRDVLLAQRADIVQPGPYNAVAALLGASALTVLAGPLGLDPIPVAAVVILLVAALRVLSVWRGWEAPVAVDLPLRTRHRLGQVRAFRMARRTGTPGEARRIGTRWRRRG
ncbi:trimeric intracellular cation channel family protein [Geodermatophilus ruber]|uniref:trimeric intracellular cation channel family protein n=1 Tax=Geodermatophilus ruber TaxID=504800 RepID=UPI000B8A34AC|nr:TRIC cation channel family protein [Geodermatophilus ruber]